MLPAIPMSGGGRQYFGELMQRFLINLLLLLIILGVLFFFSPLSKLLTSEPPATEIEIVIEPAIVPADEEDTGEITPDAAASEPDEAAEVVADDAPEATDPPSDP